MKGSFAAILVLAGLGTALALAAPPSRKTPPAAPEAPEAPAADVQDVVYFSPDRPVLLRLHLFVDGKPFREQWDAFIDQVFRYLDANGDGVVNEREASRVPQAAVLFGGNGFITGPGGGLAQIDFKALDSDGDGKVSRAELSQFYRNQGVLPFRVTTGGGSNRGVRFINANTGRLSGEGDSPDALDKALFDLLDTNKDGKLSPEELAAAPGLLLKRDSNDDEMITPDELLSRSAGNGPGLPGTLAYTSVGGGTSDASFFVVAPGRGAELARQLQIRYGKGAQPGPDLKLSRAQLGLDAETFAALDTDRDGFLDAAELAKFADRAADLELKVRINTAQQPRAPRGLVPPPAVPAKPESLAQASVSVARKIVNPQPEPQPAPLPAFWTVDGGDSNALVQVVVPPGRKSPLADAVDNRPGGPAVQLGRTRLEFQAAADPTGMRSTALFRPNLLEQYLEAFKALDTAGKGYITEQEAKGHPLFQAVFKLMDRDGDGMLYEKEIREYLSSMESLEGAASRATVTLTSSTQGRGLFDLIDTDHDGRLSVREMRRLPDVLAKLDRDGKGGIVRSDVPRRLQIGFETGGGGGGVYAVAFVAFGPGSQAQPPQPGKGPAWFQKMDRNHDGDVSRREFLGTDAQFKEIDTDGDGLISPEEAEAYDRRVRAKDKQGDR